MLKTIRYQLPAIIWAIFITILCEMPALGSSDSGIPLFEGIDKLAHTGFFFVLTVFLFYGKIREQSSYSYRLLTIFKILIITFSLGALIEILQMKVFTYRSAEWWDLFADMTGVGMGIFSYVLLHRVRINEKLY